MKRITQFASRSVRSRSIGFIVGCVALSSAALAQNVVEVTTTTPTLVGGQTAKCNVKIDTAAPVGGTVVALSSDTVKIEVPATVTVAETKKNIAFNAKTQTVLVESTGTITATIGASTQTLTLTLQVGGLTDGVVDEEVASGGTGSGYVFLSGPAGVGGVEVELLSKDPGVLAVDATTTVAEGDTDSADFTMTAAVVAADALTSVRARVGNSIRLFPVAVRVVDPSLVITVKKANLTPRNNAVVQVTYSDLTTETIVTGPNGIATFSNAFPGAATFTVTSPKGAWGPVGITVDAFDPTVVAFTES